MRCEKVPVPFLPGEHRLLFHLKEFFFNQRVLYKVLVWMLLDILLTDIYHGLITLMQKVMKIIFKIRSKMSGILFTRDFKFTCALSSVTHQFRQVKNIRGSGADLQSTGQASHSLSSTCSHLCLFLLPLLSQQRPALPSEVIEEQQVFLTFIGQPT